MKKLLFFLLLGFGAAAQVVNAPKIPYVNIERLRTDEVSFKVRFQENGANLNISGLTFRCDVMERGIAYVRVALTEGSGITKTDSTVTVTLTPQQVQLLSKAAYQYRLYTVAGSIQTTRLAGNFSLWQTAPPSGSGYSSVPPVININYTTSGSINTGTYVAPPTLTAGNALTITGGGGAYTISVNYSPLDTRYLRISNSLNLAEATPVATWAAMVALGTPLKSTAYRVENDENKNTVRALYVWWSDGKRQWIPAVDDN